jgi:EF hand
MTTASAKHTLFEKIPSNLVAYVFYVGGVLLAGVCAAVLIGACAARAQSLPATAPASSVAEAPPAPATASDTPRYSARDIERAFGFIDANKDGKISREEASGFRNVAKYFDAADSNKDDVLSLEEFGNALNRP